MEIATLIDELDREGPRLAACATGDLSRPVPTCAPWTLRELLAHLGNVHRWATRQVDGALAAEQGRRNEATMVADAPEDGALAIWLADGHRLLVEALRRAPADLSCWTFLPAPSPLAFWARRQLHETTIHRIDAELARGCVPTLPSAAVAADGIEEVLYGFHARRRRDPPEPGASPGTMRLVATDWPASWGVRLEPDTLVALPEDEPADVVVTGTAAALYLTAWNRPAEIAVRGDASVLERYARRCRIIWS